MWRALHSYSKQYVTKQLLATSQALRVYLAIVYLFTLTTTHFDIRISLLFQIYQTLKCDKTCPIRQQDLKLKKKLTFSEGHRKKKEIRGEIETKGRYF